jgi:hypothetical protein
MRVLTATVGHLRQISSRALIIERDFCDDEIADGTAIFHRLRFFLIFLVGGNSNRQYYRLDSIVEMTSEWHHNYQTLYILGPYVHQLIARQFPHLAL